MSAALQPLATSVTSPLSQARGKTVPVNVLHLDEVPAAMEKMGWATAARLMRHWFSIKPAWEMPEEMRSGRTDPLAFLPSQLNASIVKMDWLLGEFKRVQPVLEDLLQNWASTWATRVLVDRLKRARWTSGKILPVSIGYGLEDAQDLDALSQINFRTIGSKLDRLDDLYGALGVSSLKLAVAGTTRYSPLSGRSTFHTEKVGIYVRDTYDFNATGFEDWIPLGIWSRDRCLDKAETAAYLATQPVLRSRKFPGFVPLYNDDFRRWQRAHNAGGDFVVYSDIKWYRGNFPVIDLP